MADKGERQLLKSSFGVGAATLLSRILGLLRVRLEATVLGGGEFASGWFLAFAIPNLLRRLLGEGALGAALIPLVAQAEHDNPERVRRELAVIFTALSALLAAIVVLIAGGTLLLRELVWDSNIAFFNTERMRLTLILLPILMPYGFFICLVGAIGAVLNYAKVFVLPALGALLLNLFLIGGLAAGSMLGISADRMPPFLSLLAVLVLISGFVQLMLMLLLLAWYGRFPLLKRSSFRDAGVLSRLWKLALPGMIGGAALQISFVVDRLLAVWIGPRAVPALTFVDRIVDLPIGIFALSLGAVLMASMSRSAAAGDTSRLADELFFGLRHVYFACIPMAVAVIIFHRPMLELLCLGGNYTVEDLAAARWVAVFYGAGIPCFCSIKVLLPAFYSRKDMITPLKFSLIAIAANVLLNLALMFPLQQGGLALATVLASMLNNTLLITRLRRDGLRVEGRALLFSGARALIAAAVAAAAAFGAENWLDGRIAATGWMAMFAIFMLVMAIYGVIYLLAARLLRAPEIAEIFPLLLRRRRQRE